MTFPKRLSEEDFKRIKEEVVQSCTLELTPSERSELINGDCYTKAQVAKNYADALDEIVPWSV